MPRILGSALAATLLPFLLAAPANAEGAAGIRVFCDPVTWSVDYVASSSGHARSTAIEVRVDLSTVDEYPDHGVGSAVLGEPRRQRTTPLGSWSERKRLVRGEGVPAGPRPHTRTHTLHLTVTEGGTESTAHGSCRLSAP